MKIICVILMYFYLYSSINFLNFLNQPIRVYIGVFGLILLGLKIFKNKKINLKKHYILILGLSLLLTMYWEIGSLVNNTEQTSPFDKFFLKQIFGIIRAYLIYEVYKHVYRRKFYLNALSDIVKVVILDNTLALFRYFLPALNEKIISLQMMQKDFSIVTDLAKKKSRLVGVGATFFEAGIVNSIALVIIVYLIFFLKKQHKKLIIAYIFIALVGSFSSRTTTIGVVVSVGCYSILNSKNIIKLIKKLFCINLISLIIIGSLITILAKSSIIFKKLYEDFFIKQGKGSLEVLGKMWEVFPKSEKTLIFGDFKWQNYSNGKFLYYMHTDVGYLRTIWAIGITGLALMFFYNFFLWLKIQKKLLKPEKVLLTTLFVMQMIFNFKGFVDTIPLIYFLVITYEAKKRLIGIWNNPARKYLRTY